MNIEPIISDKNIFFGCFSSPFYFFWGVLFVFRCFSTSLDVSSFKLNQLNFRAVVSLGTNQWLTLCLKEVTNYLNTSFSIQLLQDMKLSFSRYCCLEWDYCSLDNGPKVHQSIKGIYEFLSFPLVLIWKPHTITSVWKMATELSRFNNQLGQEITPVDPKIMIDMNYESPNSPEK